MVLLEGTYIMNRWSGEIFYVLEFDAEGNRHSPWIVRSIKTGRKQRIAPKPPFEDFILVSAEEVMAKVI